MGKTIMIVDDEKDIRSAVKTVLSDAGYSVITASSGQEVLNRLAKALPDLVLIDMFMPIMSGRELCEKIREDEKLKNLKLAFLTVAEFSSSGKTELKKLKILDYIVKPFVNEDLVRRVKKMVG